MEGPQYLGQKSVTITRAVAATDREELIAAIDLLRAGADYLSSKLNEVWDEQPEAKGEIYNLVIDLTSRDHDDPEFQLAERLVTLTIRFDDAETLANLRACLEGVVKIKKGG